jgi:hypothetical protein
MVAVDVFDLQKQFSKQIVEFFDRVMLYITDFVLIVRVTHQVLDFSLFDLLHGLDSPGSLLIEYLFVVFEILRDLSCSMFKGLDFEGFGLS